MHGLVGVEVLGQTHRLPELLNRLRHLGFGRLPARLRQLRRDLVQLSGVDIHQRSRVEIRDSRKVLIAAVLGLLISSLKAALSSVPTNWARDRPNNRTDGPPEGFQLLGESVEFEDFPTSNTPPASASMISESPGRFTDIVKCTEASTQ